MMGNVWEWYLDSWHTNYTGAPTDGSAWEPETGSNRMFRGGGWIIDSPGDFPVSESQQQPGQQEQQHRFSRARSSTVLLDGRTPNRVESSFRSHKADKPKRPCSGRLLVFRAMQFLYYFF
jgi:formylglycine-generating enzyme required for sulfatase activity